jgi:hypothetical protein
MVLNTKNRLIAHFQGRYCAVVEVPVGNSHALASKAVCIKGKAVVLTGDFHRSLAAAGMVQAPVAVAKLEGGAAQG